MKNIFENGVCYICNQHFGIRSDSVHISHTLARQDYKLGHTLENCKPCCKRCNCLKSDSDDLEMIKLRVQLNNFAYEYGFPRTLGKGDSDNYFIMRDIITGGLPNTRHRLNIAGES
jgi:5-methylcytosine-specific restriction endonuclease McrA